MRVQTEFLNVIRMLNAGHVRYVIVGGVAMRLLGSAHVTDDIDIAYAHEPQDLTNLVRVMTAHHARLRGVPEDLPFIFDERSLQNVRNLTLTTDMGDVDILGEPAGVENFEGLWERAIEMEIEDEKVRVASVVDLMAMKRAANRPKDRQHLLELEDLLALINAERGESPS